MSAVTRRGALAGVAVPKTDAPERDPILDLIDRFLEARRAYCSEDEVSDAESDAFDESVLTPAETALLAGRPTTHDGVVALLKLAVEDHKRDSGGLTTKLIENIYIAISGGSVTTLPSGDKPDDALTLARHWWEVYREVNERDGMSDDERDAYMAGVVMPVEEELKAAHPTTREGVIAVLDVAWKNSEQGIDEVATPLIANARDALKGGVS